MPNSWQSNGHFFEAPLWLGLFSFVVHFVIKMTNLTSAHFLTGATGFVGSSLLLELLQSTDDQILCLVRSSDNSAQDRLHLVIKNLISLYQLRPSLLQLFNKRCQVISGDILEPADILFEQIIQQTNCKIQQVWHSAASLNYEDRFADEICTLNVGGTKTVIELAKRLGAETFNHFSTSYVAGVRTGRVMESYVPDPQLNANAYERSKSLGEQVIGSTTEIHTRIFRPSIVIGHDKTLGAFNFTGLYGFIRRLHQFKKIMSRINRGYLESNPIRIVADGNAQLNLVPVNTLATQAVAVGLGSSPMHHFHLTSSDSPTVAKALNTVFTGLGLPEPELIASPEEYNWIDRQFNEKIDFYASYLNSGKIFDRSNIDAALGQKDDFSCILTDEELKSHVDWYISSNLNAKDSVQMAA